MYNEPFLKNPNPRPLKYQVNYDTARRCWCSGPKYMCNVCANAYTYVQQQQSVQS